MVLDVSEQIERFQEFFQGNYETKLQEILAEGKKSVIIDFKGLSEFDIELAELLLNDPENAIKAAELAVTQIFVPEEVSLRVRFENLPETQNVEIRNIRSNHLNKILAVNGIVRQTSDVRPQITMAKFECPSCGNTISILQVETRFKEPSRCTCGRRGTFRLVHKDLVDAQRLVIEEVPERLEGGSQPKRISVFLKEDLVEPKLEKKTTPGAKVRVNGIVREVPIMLKTGAQSIRYDLMVDANFVEAKEETFEDVEINKEEEQKIIELSKDPYVYDRLRNSIAPSIYGHENIKDALVLQLMGGVKKEKKDGTKTRGNMHILLVGDPGSAKSTLLLAMSKVAPKARYVAGRGASSAGLCVSPDSLILKNPGSIVEIKEVVESKLMRNSKNYCRGVWRSPNLDNESVYLLDNNLKVKSGIVEDFWKLKSPKEMVSIKLASGKEITLTKNTKLFTINKIGVGWRESKHFNTGDYVATARQINAKSDYKMPTISLISRNATVFGVKPFLKDNLKNYNKRKLANKLCLNENNLYHNWIKDGARGNINLNNLRRLLKEFKIAETRIANLVRGLSLYKGYKIRIPPFINKDLLYFAGLMAGDGDLSKGKNSVSIRFSNGSELLLKEFERLSFDLFGVKCNVSSKESENRPKSLRFSSYLVAEILNKLGIPLSPKSHRIDMSPVLLNLSNELVSSFISGYFDCDGSAVLREKGSSSLEISSTSKKMIEKLNLVLLRYGIIGKIRKRKLNLAPNTKIKSRYDKYVLTIYGKDNFIKFRENINFKHLLKKEKLNKMIEKINKYNTNTDIIPFMNYFMNAAKSELRLTSREILGYKSSSWKRNRYSRYYLNKVISKIHSLKKESCRSLKHLKILSRSDIFWDKIKSIEIIKPDYEYVYDLTVSKAHNFLVNGVVVHNTAAVVKDEFLKGWALEAGTLVLANGGYAMIDELDKISTEDTSALHEVLANEQVSISKANIQAVLRAETTLLSAANPKFGRFDPYQPIAAQINLPPALLNRFDLIFPVRDLPSREKDEKIASHVLETMRNVEKSKPEISTDFMKKLVSYARQKCKPILTDTAINAIKKFYVDLRNSGTSGGDGVRPIPISARQLEAIVRLAEASARVRLAKKVTSKDAYRAIQIMTACLEQVGIDPATGKIDIDMIGTGITASTRNKIVMLREIIVNLSESKGKTVAMGDIVEEAKKKEIKENEVYDLLEKLKKEGELYEPKKGFISRI